MSARPAALLLALAGCAPSPAPAPMAIAAAASLRELCERTAPAFVAAHPQVTLRFAFGASSTLARQIGAGSPFAAFLSADAANLDLVRSQLVAASVTPFLGNQLVVVVRAGLQPVATDANALAQLRGRLALAAPAVPAGRYARAWLAKTGVLGALEPRIVSCDDVRATLALVQSGAADAGIVYHTDVRTAGNVTVAFAVPQAEAPGIRYLAAAVAGPQAELATAYVRWLGSAAFQDEARALGFLPPP